MSMAVSNTYSEAIPVVNSDTTVLKNVMGLYVAATGTLFVDTATNKNVSLGSPPAGTTIEIRVVKVRAASTAVVVALYQ